MTSKATWYYLENSRQIGPYALVDLELLLERGAISPDTLVWTKHRSWAPMGEVCNFSLATQQPKQHSPWMLLLAIALFCGGLTYEGKSPEPDDATNHAAMLVSAGTMLVSADISYDGMERPAVASPPLREERPRPPSAGNQLVQEYWRAIAHSKVIGRYEYYLRRSPSGSFAQSAAERIKELSSETLPEEQTVTPKKKETVASVERRPKKTRPESQPPEIAKKTEGRCWSRNMDVCRERCRNGEKLACQKLVRLGG